MYRGVLLACMQVHLVLSGGPKRSEEGVGLLGTGVMMSHHMGARN